LAEQEALVSVSALWRFCRRHKITRKKTRANRSLVGTVVACMAEEA
jgi:hypothetical protein